MVEAYRNFVRKFQMWHYRMTTAGGERSDASTLLSVLQASNIFSLSLLLPVQLTATWHTILFAGVPFAIAYTINRRVRRTLFIRPSFAKSLDDPVPTPKEFPHVYAYLAFTLVLFPAAAMLGFDSGP